MTKAISFENAWIDATQELYLRGHVVQSSDFSAVALYIITIYGTFSSVAVKEITNGMAL